MSTTGQELLKSFDLLPDPEKREVASEIIRRAFASTTTLDKAQLTTLYADFADGDRALAEEGIDDYDRALLVEDSE